MAKSRVVTKPTSGKKATGSKKSATAAKSSSISK